MNLTARLGPITPLWTRSAKSSFVPCSYLKIGTKMSNINTIHLSRRKFTILFYILGEGPSLRSDRSTCDL